MEASTRSKGAADDPAHQHDPRGPRLGLRRAEPRGRIHGHLHEPFRRDRQHQAACGRRRRRPAPPARSRLARDLVRVAPGDAGARSRVHGRRGRPARHRPLRQARRRLRHRHTRNRPRPPHGRARPPAIRRLRDRYRDAHRARSGRRLPRPRPAPGRLRGAASGHRPVAAAVRAAGAERQVVAPHVQPASGRGERGARSRTRGDLLRRGVRRLGRRQQASRGGRRLLRRHAPLRPTRSAGASASIAPSPRASRRTTSARHGG